MADGGQHWTNLTPQIPGLPPKGTLGSVEPGRYDPGTCYITVDLHQVDNRDPFLYKTTDYGRTWKAIGGSIPKGPLSYAHVLRESPHRKGLLFAGTENGLYVSFDDGGRFEPLQSKLPHAPVHWLTIQEQFHDLVVGTYGRGFFILDDLSGIEQLTAEVRAQDAHLFAPRPPYRFREVAGPALAPSGTAAGKNPPYGASIQYWLKAKAKAPAEPDTASGPPPGGPGAAALTEQEREARERELLGLDTGAVYTLENETLLLGATSPSLLPQFPDDLRVAHLRDHPHILEAVTTMPPVYLHDARTSPLSAAEKSVVDSRGLISILYFPLVLKESSIGIFIIGTTHNTRQFSSSDIELGYVLSSQVSLAVANAQLYKKAQEAIVDLTRAYDATLEGWSRVLDMRDHATDEHTQPVAGLTVALARRMGIPESDLGQIRRGALIHDIGKMAIPDSILQKPDDLSDEEQAIMQTHPEKAFQILSQIDYLLPAIDIPYCQAHSAISFTRFRLSRRSKRSGLACI